jgi:hypothetical protein
LRDKFAAFLSNQEGLTNSERTEFKVDMEALQTNKEIRVQPTHDVAIVRLAVVNADGSFGFNTKIVEMHGHSVKSFRQIGQDMIGRLAQVNVGDDVYVFGYPTSIGLQQSPKFDYSMPLLRKGIVSGVFQKAQTIILDSSVYFGNSGGPVMEVDRSNVSVTKSAGSLSY